MNIRFFVHFLLIVLFSYQLALGADSYTVEKMTDHYLQLYQSGEPAKAFQLYWNWDRFCTKAFGKRYSTLKSSDRKQAQDLVLSISTSIFLNGDILAEMRKAKFTNQFTLFKPDGSVQFGFETIFSDGSGGGKNILHIEQIDNKPFVVDLENDGLLTDKLSTNYMSVKDKVSLISFLKQARNEALKAISDSRDASNDWLYGTWELTYDPDNSEKDRITFKQFGAFVLKGSKGANHEGFYSVKNNRVILSLVVKNKVVEVEMMISGDKSKLTNRSGAYYTRISKS